MDIFASCFVFASAGCGKTKVLVDRFVKHLMNGCRPRDIMCVTFTRAAVFEMANRLGSLLQELESASEEKLKKYLQEVLDIQSPSDKQLERARTLYSLWIEDYSNLNIVTIHSFCQKLLEEYPIESGVYPEFTVLDELEADCLLAEAKTNFFREIRNSTEIVVNDLARFLSNFSFEELLGQIISELPKFRRFLLQNPNIDEYEKKLKKLFRLGDFKELPSPWSATDEALFLTQSGCVRKKIKIPGIAEDEAQRIANIFFENRNNFNKRKTILKTMTFIRLVQKILIEYNHLKAEKNQLDFTDLIHKTEFLLKESESSAFVIYQISRGIKHLMIDEAQDLNTDQWSIISILFDEILLHSSDNTIFVVGDLKQSIYGFQDASPKLFSSFYHKCLEVLPKVGKKMTTALLTTCYRCSPAILSLVDRVFSFPGFHLQGYEKHTAFRTDPKGEAEIVPMTDLVKELPAFLKKIIDEGIKPADIMVLAKNRKSFEGLEEALIQAGIKTSGLDKKQLGDFLIIQDVLALAEFCVDSSNDYALACLLKSPNIFDHPLDDRDLYELCYNREGDIFSALQNFSEHIEVLNKINGYSSEIPVVFFYKVYNFLEERITSVDKELLQSFLELVQRRGKKYCESLSDFVAWFKKNKIQFQKDNNASEGVRLNTIHSSKGLESEVVILLDFSLAAEKAKIKFLWKDQENFFIVKPSSKETFEEIEAVIDSHLEEGRLENLRLLYVALTRARQRLYIVGPSGKDGIFQALCTVFHDC